MTSDGCNTRKQAVARAEAAEARIAELEAEVARLRYENEMMIRYIIIRSSYQPPSRMSCSTEARLLHVRPN
jgi:hypothetical protein